MSVYAIGQIKKIKDKKSWEEYKKRVKLTLENYNAKVLFRGEKADSFVETTDFSEIVVIEFESKQIAKAWFESEAYQSIVPLRQKGAEVTLELYE